MTAPRRRLAIRLQLVVVAATILLPGPSARVWATPHTDGSVRGPAVRVQVVRLFDRLDRVSRALERLRDEMALVDDRISELSRRIEAEQQILNRRAAEAYMAGRAGEIESVLSAGSLGELQDAFRYIEAVSQDDHDLLVSLRHRRGELTVQRDLLEGLADDLRGTRDRLDATVSELVQQLRRQQADEERAVGAPASTGSVEEPPPSITTSESFAPMAPSSREDIASLIRERFASLGPATTRVALCVAARESGFDPLAENPVTGAAGVFQFLPATWDVLSDLAGRSGASVFDPRANVSVAAWTVSRYGWHPWRSLSGSCGV